ncbi:hypothetical protein DRO58_06270 [Candidatus Bathyarchaeota archaeon]|nr:MAG: hypothetical protein DRO58_06270 [Candidatus Bathyarchaeota archaeon]
MKLVERSAKKLVLLFGEDERAQAILLTRPSIGGLDILYKGGRWDPQMGVHLHVKKAKITIEEAEE